MTKTFWISAILAMLLIMGSYGTNYKFKPVTDISNAALEIAGIDMRLGDTTYFAISLITQYFILMSVFYFFLRSVSKSFRD